METETGSQTGEEWASCVYPPEFWDGLSKISLTREALDELNRRIGIRRRSNSQHQPLPPLPPCPAVPLPAPGVLKLAPGTTKTPARFARHGGPDLCDLRIYPPPAPSRPGVMAYREASCDTGTQSTDPKSSKKSTPYQGNFAQHLEDHSVYPPFSRPGPDMTAMKAIQEALAARRPSLSSSNFSDDAFRTLQRTDARASDELHVVESVMPALLVPEQFAHPSARGIIFGNLEKLTDGTITAAKPDVYYGAHPSDLDPCARAELSHLIVPSTQLTRPLAPNFFVELKGPRGTAFVARLQAQYDGAMGCRSMHSLQNYGETEPKYDGNMYTFSSIYHNGQLTIYAHHLTAPATKGARPEYHMNAVRVISLMDSRDAFVEGATALRNARDLEKQHRDDFIRAANEKARMGGLRPGVPTERAAAGQQYYYYIRDPTLGGYYRECDKEDPDLQHAGCAPPEVMGLSSPPPSAQVPTPESSPGDGQGLRKRRRRSSSAGSQAGRLSKTRERPGSRATG